MAIYYVVKPYFCTKLFLVSNGCCEWPSWGLSKASQSDWGQASDWGTQERTFSSAKAILCSFNSLLWLVVWLSGQNFCWTSIGRQTCYLLNQCPDNLENFFPHSALWMMLHCLCVSVYYCTFFNKYTEIT